MHKNTSLVETSFQENAGLEFVPLIFFLAWVREGTSFKNVLRGIVAIPLVQEVATLLNMNYLEYKVYRTNSKGNFK